MGFYNFLLVISAVLLGSTGQLFLKNGVNKVGKLSIENGGLASLFLKIFSQPSVVIGVSLYVVSFFVWLIAISKVDISQAYPMLAVGLAANAIGAHYFLGESLGGYKLAGIICIGIGTYLIAQNTHG
jgi:multidrug transporter EmrE-like cation transporter